MLNRIIVQKSLLAICYLFLSACSSITETPSEQVENKAETSQASVTSADSAVSWQPAISNSPKKVKKPTAPAPEAKQQITLKPSDDLWERIRAGYEIATTDHMEKKTQQRLRWFVDHPEYINRVVERARPYLHHIVDQLEQRNMPMEVALLPVVESGYQPFAYSHGRAAGLWQFIPGTGKLYGLKQTWWYDGRRDVIESTRAALDYLQKLHNDFGDWQLALAAYNCGEGTVSRAIKRNQKKGLPTDFWSLKLPTETSAYVPKLMAVSQLFKNPAKYNLTIPKVDNSPFLTVVDVGSQIDLKLAAELAEISTDELYQLNPGFNRWATSPDGPHRLVIPLKNAATFQQALQDLPANKRVQWSRHKIKSGESLGLIAKHYHTTIDVIKEANGLENNLIRAGHHLLIPIATGEPSDYPMTVSQRLASRQSSSGSGHKKTYTVKAGDTWWDIANEHNTSVHKLASWNDKAPGDLLHPGQKLVVWTKAPTGTSKTMRTINYTIRNGDSLWTISRRFKVTVAQVREWNGLSDRTLLRPGQNLTLHVDVRQQHDSI